MTICVWQREHLFGRVVDGVMELNEYGGIVANEWAKTSELRPNTEIDEFVVMPNHFHGVIWIQSKCRGMAVTCPNIEGASPPRPYGRFGKPIVGSLGQIIGHFKSIATKRINKIRQTPGFPIWQRNYYERIIRNDAELNRIRQYIIDNPHNWDHDPEHPKFW